MVKVMVALASDRGSPTVLTGGQQRASIPVIWWIYLSSSMSNHTGVVVGVVSRID
jgi:hypothetical protein